MRRLRACRIGRSSGICSARKGLHEPAWMHKDRGFSNFLRSALILNTLRLLVKPRFRLNFIFQTETLSDILAIRLEGQILIQYSKSDFC